MTAVELHTYFKRERSKRYVLECKNDPMLRGEASRILDILLDYYLSKKEDHDEDFQCARISRLSIHDMTDDQVVWTVEHYDRLGKKIKMDLNTYPRYRKAIRLKQHL
jgi:hypothetical protein